MAGDDIELVSKAPKVMIETVLVVRPIKVFSTIIGFMAALFILMSTGASEWLISEKYQEGIWERCVFTKKNENTTEVDCGIALPDDWVKAPQTFSLISLLVCVVAVVVSTLGLRSYNLKIKYKLYWVALSAYFIAVGFELVSLISYPLKFLQEVGDNERTDNWNFGWAYIIGWAGAICEFSAGLCLLIDRGADEIIYRETTDEGEEV